MLPRKSYQLPFIEALFNPPPPCRKTALKRTLEPTHGIDTKSRRKQLAAAKRSAKDRALGNSARKRSAPCLSAGSKRVLGTNPLYDESTTSRRVFSLASWRRYAVLRFRGCLPHVVEVHLESDGREEAHKLRNSRELLLSRMSSSVLRKDCVIRTPGI